MHLLGKPLLVRSIENLQNLGFTQVVLVVSPRDHEEGGIVSELATRHFSLHLTVVTQSEPLGMGHALLQAKSYLQDQFVVMSPYHFEAGRVITRMIEQHQPTCVCVHPTQTPWLFGIATVDSGLLKGVIEKPAPGTEPSSLSLQSLYLLNQTFLNLLSERPTEEYSFESALDALAQTSPVGTYMLEQSLTTLKYPWHLFDLQAQLFSQLTSRIDAKAEIADTVILDEANGPIVIEAGARINDFTKLVGPVYIGRNALVGEHCFIRSSSIEAEVRVGAYTEIVRSILMEHGTFHQSYLADSITGPYAHAGAGFITANQRLDKKPVPVMVKGQKISSERGKLGVLLGAKANLGIGVHTMPGVAIGTEAVVYPDKTLFESVAPQARVT